jgi:hypothetical protein
VPRSGRQGSRDGGADRFELVTTQTASADARRARLHISRLQVAVATVQVVGGVY